MQSTFKMKSRSLSYNNKAAYLMCLYLKNEAAYFVNSMFYLNVIILKISIIRDNFIIKLYEISSKIYIKLAKHDKWDISKSDLKNYNYETLGGRLYTFLDKNNFDMIPYVENHDVFHVITQIPPTVKGEVALQCLLFGNGKKSVFLYMSICAGLLHTPENYAFYIESYKKGKHMNRFYDWSYKHLLKENFEENIIPLIYKK